MAEKSNPSTGKAWVCGKPGPHLPDEPTQDKPKLLRIIEEKDPKTAAAAGRKAVARAAKFKSELDHLFWADPHNHWAEAFHLKWEAPLLNLDFRSMYPACLLSCHFHHPAALKCIPGEHTKSIQDGEINQGIFRTLVDPPKEQKSWSRNHHYLRFRGEDAKSYHFHWPNGQRIETMLHADDILALTQAGFSTETLWGIFDPTDRCYRHPASRLVSEALKNKEAGDPNAKEDLVRLCSDKPRRHFNWDQSAQESLRISGSGVKTQALIWKGPSPLCAHSLYSPIRAAARSRIWALARALCDPQDPREGSNSPAPATLLRVHTDGLSIGLRDKDHQQEMLRWLHEQLRFPLGNGAGCLKVSEADGGFFLSHITWWEHANTPEGRKILAWAGGNKDPFNTLIPYLKHDGTQGVADLLDLREPKWLDRRAKPFPRWNRRTPSPETPGHTGQGEHGAKPPRKSRRRELRELWKYQDSFR
jgi:hypothetical protein